MAKAEWIARQSAHPRGWLGHLVAGVMAWDTARANSQALDELAVQPGEDVLDLGCGHGRTLARLSKREPAARLFGVDPSDVMRSEARRRNRAGVAAGRIQIASAHFDTQHRPLTHLLVGHPKVGRVSNPHFLHRCNFCR